MSSAIALLVDHRLRVESVTLSDGTRPVKRTAVDYSDWYYRRLDIHRWGSYAMLPLVVAPYVADTKLERGGEDNWAEDVHPLLAVASPCSSPRTP